MEALYEGYDVTDIDDWERRLIRWHSRKRSTRKSLKVKRTSAEIAQYLQEDLDMCFIHHGDADTALRDELEMKMDEAKRWIHDQLYYRERATGHEYARMYPDWRSEHMENFMNGLLDYVDEEGYVNSNYYHRELFEVTIGDQKFTIEYPTEIQRVEYRERKAKEALERKKRLEEKVAV